MTERAAFAGDIADVAVADLLETIERRRQSGSASFDTPLGSATIWFRDGALVDATMGSLRQESAVLQLLAVEAGTFEIELKPIARACTMQASWRELLEGAASRTAATPGAPIGSVTSRRSRRTMTSWHPTGGGPGRRVVGGADANAPLRERPRSHGSTLPRWPAPAPAGDEAAPATVGRYEVLLRIARGGMGTVYLCRITGEGGFRRLFALKVVREHLGQDEESSRLLLQEARIASRLHHPNVVGIVDIGTMARQHYLVMDYVEGCTLSQLLAAHRKVRPPRLVVPIMLDALAGLHAAHALTDDDGTPLVLVHCDFSPQNMLVGTDGICRITDFGIARASRAMMETTSTTRGKPAYLSPEQVLGRRVDRRSDVFSAGVVLWNALTGEQLFDGDSADEVLEAVLEGPIRPPSRVGLRPPSAFDPICLRALRRDPAQRYQTAEEMLVDLRRVAITTDSLAPASEVAKWVLDSFGRQLELRRRAAGISSRASDDDPAAVVAVPELRLGGSDEPAAEGERGDATADLGTSRTAVLRVVADAAAGARVRALVLGAATTAVALTVAVGVARPEWIRGGMIDAHGSYVADEWAPPPVPDSLGGSGDTGAAPASDAETSDTEASDADASDPQVGAKAADAAPVDADAAADEPPAATETDEAKPQAAPSSAKPDARETKPSAKEKKQKKRRKKLPRQPSPVRPRPTTPPAGADENRPPPDLQTWLNPHR